MFDPDALKPPFVYTALYVILRVMRRKNWLKPADLTDLRVALQNDRAPENLKNKLHHLLDESWLEREEKKDTPKKQEG